MVEVALRNAEHLGLDVDGRVADAERIPYDDDTFDLVVGHAVLHHIPDVPAALREVLRVLKPGGRFVFAGEPTTVRRLLRPPARPADLVADHERHEAAGAARTGGDRRPSWTSPPARPRWRPSSTCTRSTRRELERTVRARRARCDVRAVTEELSAALFGWPVRTFEAAVPQGEARHGLGDVRLPDLAATVLAGRRTCCARWCPATCSTTCS